MLNTATTLELDNTLTDRREASDEQGVDWDKLTLSQQFSVSNLGQFGYMLTYIRYVNNTPLAILKLDKKIATITADGMINIKPEISFRH